MIANLLDRIFGPRLEDDDGHEADEAERSREIEDTLVKHEATLSAIDGVLSASQRRVAIAIDETGDAIRDNRRRRRR